MNQIQFSKKEKYLIAVKTLIAITPFFLSHHPECDDFDDHVFKIGKIRLCQGCTAMYSGLIILILLVWNHILILPQDFLISFIIGSLLFFPTIVQLKFGFKNRSYRIISRWLIGFSIGIYLWSAWIFPVSFKIPLYYFPFIRIWGIFTFFFVFFGIQNLHMIKTRNLWLKQYSNDQQSPRCTGFRSLWIKLNKIDSLELYFPGLAEKARIGAEIEEVLSRKTMEKSQ